MNFDNLLLGQLPVGSRDPLIDRLDAVNLRKGQVILEAGDRVRHVYFPSCGFASLEYAGRQGETLALATAGREGMVGVPVLFGDRPAEYSATVRASMAAYRLRSSVLTAEIGRHPALYQALLDYVAGVLNQIVQAAHCHHAHSVLQRLSRWLLTADDHVGTESIEVTHEELSCLLGVSRQVITRTLAELCRADAVWFSQGRILLRRRSRLEATACECYEARSHALRRA